MLSFVDMQLSSKWIDFANLYILKSSCTLCSLGKLIIHLLLGSSLMNKMLTL